MSWIWIVLGIIAAIAVLVVAGIAIVVGSLRHAYRRRLDLQAQQSVEFPTWAREHGYTYSETFPKDDIERLRGLGSLRPFYDFELSRIEHVFRRVGKGGTRYLMQLTICADPGPDAPAVSAVTVAVTDVRPSAATKHDVRKPAASRKDASIHARGRWVTSYTGGPLTFTSMEVAEKELDRYLKTV